MDTAFFVGVCLVYGCFYQTGKTRRGNPLLTEIHKKITGGQNTVIAWRNKVFGHGVFQNDPSWYADEVNAWLDVLHQFYREVKPVLDEVRLCSVDEDGCRAKCHFAEWHGTGETPPGFVHEHVPEGEPLSMFLKTSTKRLELSPLLTLQRCSVCNQPTVFFFDKNKYESKKDQHRTWFLEYFSGHHNDKKDLKEIRHLASHVPPGFKWERTSYDQDEVDSIVRTLTQGFEQDYCRPDYLMDVLFSEIEEREKGYLHIVGPAGVGKSWLVRGMEAEWKDEGVPVLAYYVQPGALADYRTFISELADRASENFSWRTQEIQAKVASIADLKEQFAEFCGELMRANRLSRMVIAIDGLDELPEPEEGQPAITGLLPVGGKLPTGCFVALTSRPRLRPVIREDLQRLESNVAFFSRIEIDPSLDENRKLLLAYLQNKLSEEWRREEWMEEIIRRAGGVFLYTFHLANALESGAFADVQSLPEGREFYPAYLAKLRERVGDAFFDAYYLPVLLYLAAVKEPVSLEMLSAWGFRADRLSFSLLDLRDFLKTERSRERPETLYQVAHQDFIEYLQEDAVLSEKLKEVHGQIGRFALGRHANRWDELDFEEPLERYHLLWTLEHLEDGELEEEYSSLLLDSKYSETCFDIANAQYAKDLYRYALELYGRTQRCYRYRVEEMGLLEFENNLAAALANMGAMLSSLGQPRVAIDCFDEAVEVLRRQVESGREELEYKLASMLLNKGIALNSLGRPQVAIDCHDEAIEIFHWLVEGGISELADELARAFVNKSVALTSLRQHRAAIVCLDKAIGIYRRLVENGREELEKDLAAALVNKSVVLTSLGQLQLAIDYHNEAIEILRRLVEGGREELEDELGRALVNMGVACRSLGQNQVAIDYFDEATAILRRLVKDGRKELENNLATALTNMGMALFFLGKNRVAIDYYDEAIEILQGLVESGREELEKDLAWALMNKGNSLNSLEQRQIAIDCHNEAIEILRRLVESGREELEEELARVFVNKGIACRSLGQHQVAIDCFDEAIETRRRLVEGGREELENDLAVSLLNKALACEKLECWDETFQCYEEAIALWVSAIQAGQSHLQPRLSRALEYRRRAYITMQS